MTTTQSNYINNNTIIVLNSGTFSRTILNFTNYIIYTTGTLHQTIIDINGTDGVVMFTVLKSTNLNTTLHIQRFKTETDIINLQAFNNILSLKQLSMKLSHQLTTTRKIASQEKTDKSVIILLSREQTIIITNINTIDLTNRNFRFYKPPPVLPAIAKMKHTYGPIIAASVIFGSLALFIIYKFGEQIQRNYKISQLKITPIDWLEIERNNVTFISFSSQDSDTSSITNSSDLNSEDYSENEQNDSSNNSSFECECDSPNTSHFEFLSDNNDYEIHESQIENNTITRDYTNIVQSQNHIINDDDDEEKYSEISFDIMDTGSNNSDIQ
jgi:hypothetical protein